MEKRNITITLDKAKEWYNSDNTTLKDLALQAFSRDEIMYHFTKIKFLNDACMALGLDYRAILVEVESIEKISRASAAMFKLNIIKKALNWGQDLHLIKDPKDSCIYYPCNPFINRISTYYKDELDSGEMEIIGTIKIKEGVYNILGGYANSGGNVNSNAGLGYFDYFDGVGGAYANIGFLGCANKEIAKHFGRYFGMLITMAKYGDLKDFEILESKYY